MWRGTADPRETHRRESARTHAKSARRAIVHVRTLIVTERNMCVSPFVHLCTHTHTNTHALARACGRDRERQLSRSLDQRQTSMFSIRVRRQVCVERRSLARARSRVRCAGCHPITIYSVDSVAHTHRRETRTEHITDCGSVYGCLYRQFAPHRFMYYVHI